jgi:Transposase DDE domain
VRATGILRTVLAFSLQDIHCRRRDAVWRAVDGLLQGGKLWLTALGRALPGSTSDKHRIKAADRLLGNRALHQELPQFYRALAHRLLRRTNAPIIAIDWTGLASRHYLLSAQLCCEGRSVPVYERVYSKNRISNPRAEREFLHELAAILPIDCKPIIVTDGGFRSPWFVQVRALGWDFIGRVRNRTHAYLDGRWKAVHSLHQCATARPRSLGLALMPRRGPEPYRLVLSKRPKLKGRKRLTRRGTPGRRSQDHKCSSGYREPWLLVTSLHCNAKAVVAGYALRMQIEQSFRDAKNHRHGWALHHAGSKSTQRLEVLLLIAALALLVVHIVGRAAAALGLQRSFQANTVRHRRVLSCFVLGCYVLRSGIRLHFANVVASLDEIVELITKNSSPLAYR